MGVYELGLDEVVILQDSHVLDGRTNVTLILTSQNLIQVNKSFWGSDKSAVKYPLQDLKEQGGKPNVLIGKAPNGSSRLELYFAGYEKFYTFQGLFAERKWAGAIEKAYKSYMTDRKKNEKPKFDVNSIFSPFIDTIDSAKRSITPKTKMVKCPRCGAELTGEKGKEVKCSYCDTVVRIS